MRSTLRSGIAAVLAPALLCAMAAVDLIADSAPTLPATRLLASAPFNPVAGNEGYHVFVNSGAELNNTGPVSTARSRVGGDLDGRPDERRAQGVGVGEHRRGRPTGHERDRPRPRTPTGRAAARCRPAAPQTLTVDLGCRHDRRRGAAEAAARLHRPHADAGGARRARTARRSPPRCASATYSSTHKGTYPNAVVITVSPTVTGRYVRLSITGNSDAADAQIGAMQVYTYAATTDAHLLAGVRRRHVQPERREGADGLLVGGASTGPSTTRAAMSGSRRDT